MRPSCCPSRRSRGLKDAQRFSSARLVNAVLLMVVIVAGGAGAFHVKLHAPPYVVRGGSAILTCNHSVDRALLHKVEWLKDGDRKLFQFVRGRKPPFRNFSIPGATLDWSRSNEKEIRLTGLELEATGVYSCEVSMETPIYTKPSNDELITVIQRQAEDPEVWGRKPSYVVGESLEVNCTSAPSHPPADITWLVNGRQMSEKNLRWYSGHRPPGHQHHHHHRNHGHHHHHHHQYRVHSEEEGAPVNVGQDGMGDGDDADMDLDAEPAVLPAMALAPASTTVQLTFQISEENALEGIMEGENEASSRLGTSEDGANISGRLSLTCLATIPAFLGAGTKEHEYADRRLTSVDVDVVVPPRSIVEEEPVTEEQKEEEILNSAPRNNFSLFLLLPILPLLTNMLSFPSVLNSKTWYIHNHDQSLTVGGGILNHGCPCR